MKIVKALDLFNLTMDGNTAMTVQSSRADYKHMPCVLEIDMQQTTGTLTPGGHPGSYNGQDAYNDMLVVDDDESVLCDASIRRVCHRGGASALKARDYKDATDLVVTETGQTNDEIMMAGCTTQEDERPMVAKSNVRRLTPGECEILQGFPKGWTLIGAPEEVDVKDYDITYDENGDVVSKAEIGSHKEIEYYYLDSGGKKRRCADSGRYKALGNSICTPFWFWLCRRISAQYERPATMGSLFDGIGGFPYCWVRCNGTKTVLWHRRLRNSLLL